MGWDNFVLESLVPHIFHHCLAMSSHLTGEMWSVTCREVLFVVKRSTSGFALGIVEGYCAFTMNCVMSVHMVIVQTGFMHHPAFFSAEPPSIFQWLSSCLKGEGVQPYPYLPGICERSKLVVVVCTVAKPICFTLSALAPWPGFASYEWSIPSAKQQGLSNNRV